MTGGLIQIASYGIQDIYLIGNPQITFFKTVYKKHCNFSMEYLEEFFSSNKGKKDEKYKIALDLLKLFKVDGYANNYPHEISSGEQQRVAIARAMAPNPKILLMDDPFGALDHALKSELRDETKKIFKDNGTTAIIVSHDFDDAISMSDHVLIIDDGLVAQEGSAKDLIPITRNNSFKIA